METKKKEEPKETTLAFTREADGTLTAPVDPPVDKGPEEFRKEFRRMFVPALSGQ